MQLAAKLVLIFLIGLSLVVAVFSLLTVRQVDQIILDDREKHAMELASVLRSTLEDRSLALEDLQQTVTVWSQVIEESNVRLVLPGSDDRRFQPSVPPDRVPVRTWSRTEVVTVRLQQRPGEERVYTYVPLGDELGMQIEVAANNDFWADRARNLLRNSALALAGVGTLSSLAIMLGGWLLLGKPLRQLVDKVQRIGRGDLTGPITLRSHDELGQLASAVNSMCEQLLEQREQIYRESRDKLAAVEGLRHADRLRTVGRLAAGLAHEIGTPLNVVSGRAELIASGRLPTSETARSAQIIKTETQRITEIVKQLLNFARRTPMQRSACDLNQLTRNCIDLMLPLARKQNVDLLFLPFSQEATEATSKLDAGQIQQVLTNLLMNALQAVSANGVIRVTVLRESKVEPPAESEAEPGNYWVVRVEDNGQGITPDVIDHVFEPFFTTKEVGEGTGLGLSIAYGIVQEHGGWISVSSRPGQGSTFSVYLPQLDTSQGKAN